MFLEKSITFFNFVEPKFNKKLKSIAIVGSGNMAWQLGKALYQAGYQINKVYGRKQSSAKALADELNAEVATTLAACAASDCIILAITDSAIAEVAHQIPPGEFMIVHTSGMVKLEELGNHKHRGVFYPLQSLNKDVDTTFNQIPVLIEASTPELLTKLKVCAANISTKVFEVSSNERQYVHLAAVFANNFTNHLLGISYEIMDRNGIDTAILYPLITETFYKAIANHPNLVQTGPAKRGDMITVSKHIDLLRQFTDYRQIYEVMSSSISMHDKNKKANA
jgi:predicted short-subunit dehydrogenase-like oxidoreductase (DUF2520 family)